LVYVSVAFGEFDDTRPEEKYYVNDKLKVGFSLSRLLAFMMIHFEKISLDVIHQPRVAVPPEKSECEFWRSLM
jgi:hypothetical protein